MISNELLDEIIYISLKGRLISKDLLLRVAYEAISNLNTITQSKFNDLKFIDIDFEFAMGRCVKEDGLIELDYNKLISKYKKVLNYPKLEINLLIIQYLFHEIEHLNEFYKVTKNDLESKLIKCSDGEYILYLLDTIAFTKLQDENEAYDYSDKLYMEYNTNYWDIIPIEKIAQADSFKGIITSLDAYENFDRKYLETYNDMILMYCNSLKMGYCYDKKLGRYNVPLLDYLKVLKSMGGEFKFPAKEVNYTLEEKLKYGLKINKVDFEEMEQSKIKKY